MIEGVLSKDVDVWWPYVEEYLISALNYGLGEYTIEDIKKSCIMKDMQLWVNLSNKVEGAFVTKINTYPQKNILVVLLLGGNNFSDWKDEADTLLSAFGKENNCEYVQLAGRKGWSKVLQNLNYKETIKFYTKELS
jgi:hypothetical protein